MFVISQLWVQRYKEVFTFRLLNGELSELNVMKPFGEMASLYAYDAISVCFKAIYGCVEVQLAKYRLSMISHYIIEY